MVICTQSVTADGDLLLVRISPDQEGKFGFNVKVSQFIICIYHHYLDCIQIEFCVGDHVSEYCWLIFREAWIRRCPCPSLMLTLHLR